MQDPTKTVHHVLDRMLGPVDHKLCSYQMLDPEHDLTQIKQTVLRVVVACPPKVHYRRA